ncbi:methionine ABC transporter substrate-binding protein, partial [Staphylococcus haemolyticus]
MLRRSLLLSAMALTLSACGAGGEKAGSTDGPLLVGATAVPDAEILEHIKPILAAEGVPIEIKVFNDYVQPNVQVAESRLDVNYFQTKP